MFFFTFVILPALCLLSLVIGVIYAYRVNQAGKEEHITEASAERQTIIFMSLCCAFVLLSLVMLYFGIFATEPIDYSPVDSNGMLIILLGFITILVTVLMWFLGFLVIGIMLGTSFGRSIICTVFGFCTTVVFLFSLFALSG